MSFNGIGLHNIWQTSNTISRSVTPENITGEKGAGGAALDGVGAKAARELGQGWKISPAFFIEPGAVLKLAEIEGPGLIQHIWMTTDARKWRTLILRIYWDDQTHPSVEVPLGDFFANGWEEYAHVNSHAVCVNPGRAFNCYWPMPFAKSARFEIENRDIKKAKLFYQIDYCLTGLPENTAYFHASFRRTNPVPYRDVCTIVDGIRGKGQYVGTYLAWGVNNNGCWVEGEAKFYLDGDEEFPTICGTGTEDYFGGAFTFDIGRKDKRFPNAFTEYSTAYAGLCQVIRPDGVYRTQQRFGMYRWHIPDPIYFEHDLRVTIQALGWRDEADLENRRYLPLQDDIAATAFWYQTLPGAPFRPLQDADYLDVI